jgi:hypothetical protein
MTAARMHQTGSCPNCGSGTLVEGRLLGQLDLGGGLAFRPRGRGFMGWLLRRDLSVTSPVFACVQCGLMWSSIKTKPLRRMMPPSNPPTVGAATATEITGPLSRQGSEQSCPVR